MRTISTLIALTGVNSIDLADQSIRFGNDRCAVKFGTGYNTGDAVLIKSCASLTSPNKHKKGKFQWEFNAETGQIVSVGSKLSGSSVFCWTLSKYSLFNNFDRAPKFCHFRGFWSKISDKKMILQNSQIKRSPKDEPEMQFWKIDFSAENLTPKT